MYHFLFTWVIMKITFPVENYLQHDKQNNNQCQEIETIVHLVIRAQDINIYEYIYIYILRYAIQLHLI